MKLYLDTIKIPVIKLSKKPRFKDGSKFSWDQGTIKIDGMDWAVLLDTSWGSYIYFYYADGWYKLRMQSKDHMSTYDIDPFQVPEIELTTEKLNER